MTRPTELPQNSVIILIVNNTSFFFSHRWNIALEARRRQQKIMLLSPSADKDELAKLHQHGIAWQAVPFNRHKNFLTTAFRTFFFMLRLARKLEREYAVVVFHLVTILPILFCGLPLRLSGRRCVFALSGLGSMFSSERKKHQIGRLLITRIYGFLMRAPRSRLIVQNQDDFKWVLEDIRIAKNHVSLIRGSGLDIQKFPFSPKLKMNTSELTLLLPGRLIREKGIFEAAELSQYLKSKGLAHRFLIVGGPDPGNPFCLSPADIAALKKQAPALDFVGHCQRMKEIYEEADLIVFPSHREGLPKALLEAAAIGRPIVAFDVPGVREFIKHNQTGLLAKFGDIATLGSYCLDFLNQPVLRDTITRAARLDVEQNFAESIIVEQIFNVYDSLLNLQ